MPRYFTLEQAQSKLQEVERHLRDALFYKEEYQKTEDELARTSDRIRMAGGSFVNVVGVQTARNRRDRYASSLKQALEHIEETGAVVKDLDIGLIDFLTLYRNREVCLCWKLGEEGIGFWHGAEEGFRGRKPIDDDFLSQHRGESEH